MKTILITALLTMASSFACSQYEAQFTGTVSKASIVSEDKCLLDLNVETYSASFSCPLLLEDVINKKVTVSASKCDSSIINSNQSGILVLDSTGKIIIE